MNNIEELNIEYLKINARSVANGVAAISSKWAGETILALVAQLEAAEAELCNAEFRGVEKLAKAFKSWADESNGDYEAERHWAVASKEAFSFAADMREALE